MGRLVVSTHSLLLLREFEILCDCEFPDLEQRYFALRRDESGVDISQAVEIGDVDPLLALDEELGQSDRFIDRFMPSAESEA